MPYPHKRIDHNPFRNLIKPKYIALNTILFKSNAKIGCLLSLMNILMKYTKRNKITNKKEDIMKSLNIASKRVLQFKKETLILIKSNLWLINITRIQQTCLNISLFRLSNPLPRRSLESKS